MKFRIPVMSIQDKLFNLDNNPKILKLKDWIEKTVEKERNNWGIRGEGYECTPDLEAQWYMIFEFNNRWLADAFVSHLGKIKK